MCQEVAGLKRSGGHAGKRPRDRESGLEGPGGFDRQQQGAGGQLRCLPAVRLSAETFPPSSSSLPPFLYFFPGTLCRLNWPQNNRNPSASASPSQVPPCPG